MTPPVDRRRRRGDILLMRLLVVQTIAVVCIIGFVVYQGYEGRTILRDSQVAGCERGKLDRSANATGWRAAERARRQTGTASDLIAAEQYARIAAGQEERSRLDCTIAFPEPALIP